MIRGPKEFETRGFLTATEQAEVYINQFEFSGFENCLWALLPQAVPNKMDWPSVHVSVELDNVTSIKYGRVAVSRSLRMSLMGARFFDKVERAGISLSFRHLAGEANVEADALSRKQSTHADWKFDTWLFRKVRQLFEVTPSMDLFASAQNTQTKTFFSYNHDHRAKGADAFLHDWQHLGVLYAYPPPILLGKVLQKLLADSCRHSIVILPVWVAQTWFPTMMEMLMAPPILLPNERWIVSDPVGNRCWPERWPLAACHLSGISALSKASRRRYSRSVGKTLKTAIRHDMTRILNDSQSGGKVPTLLLRSVQQQFAQDC